MVAARAALARSPHRTSLWIPFRVSFNRAYAIAREIARITGRPASLRFYRFPGTPGRYSVVLWGFVTDTQMEAIRRVLDAQRTAGRTRRG